MNALIFISLVLLSNVLGQTECLERIVKTETSNGIIMQNSSYAYSLPKETSRFFPQKKLISKIENQLEIDITSINKDHFNQIDQSEYLENNLTKYNRQYFGFLNKEGEKMIFINLFKESINCEMDEELIVLDGCSDYWQIFYNVVNKSFYDFSVNGCA